MAKTYLTSFTLTPERCENKYVEDMKQTCYNSMWPFHFFPLKEIPVLEFEPVTVFYGGNGSGKTTLLNVIAERLSLHRHSPFSGSPLFGDYVEFCEWDGRAIPEGSQILTSDDVTDYLIDLRNLNNGIDERRREIFDDYYARRGDEPNLLRSLEDYDEWKATADARSRKVSKSQYVRDRLMGNVDMYSNGETAMRYYVERIRDNTLCLMDEPENSLSAARQRELAQYIADSARHYGCQFVISTHSPFFLAIPGARIYDLDAFPVTVRRWTELENVRVYYDFFTEHGDEFE